MVWRELKKLDTENGYRLRSLKPGLEAQVEALRRDIRSDREVTLSSHREGFYEGRDSDRLVSGALLRCPPDYLSRRACRDSWNQGASIRSGTRRNDCICLNVN